MRFVERLVCVCVYEHLSVCVCSCAFVYVCEHLCVFLVLAFLANVIIIFLPASVTQPVRRGALIFVLIGS